MTKHLQRYHAFGSLTNSNDDDDWGLPLDRSSNSAKDNESSSFDALINSTDDDSSHSFGSPNDVETHSCEALASSTDSFHSFSESSLNTSSNDLNTNDGNSSVESFNIDGNETPIITDTTIPSLSNVDQPRTKRRKIAKHRTNNSQGTTTSKRHFKFSNFLIQ